MDAEAKNELWEFLENLTPAERRFMHARAMPKFAIQLRNIKTRSAGIQAAFKIAADILLDAMYSKSPACYCGHKKIQHALYRPGCAVPYCECMCFHEANPI